MPNNDTGEKKELCFLRDVWDFKIEALKLYYSSGILPWLFFLKRCADCLLDSTLSSFPIS